MDLPRVPGGVTDEREGSKTEDVEATDYLEESEDDNDREEACKAEQGVAPHSHYISWVVLFKVI